MRQSSGWRSLAIRPVPKKLQGTGGSYRIRIGDYRVVYQVENERLVVGRRQRRSPPRHLPKSVERPVNAWQKVAERIRTISQGISYEPPQ